MIDTGAGITLVTKQWAEAHRLKVSAPSAGKVYGAAGSEVEIVGTTAFTVQLTPTLEVDLANVCVSSGAFYQALLGCDLLEGHEGVLGPAVIHLGGRGKKGSIQWEQTKLGCIAVAPFIEQASSVNAASREALPPPPPKAPAPELTLDSPAVKLDSRAKGDLKALAQERDLQRSSGTATLEDWRGLLDRAQYLFRG